ncbi:regulatory protein RecX [Dokdonella sp.]|uniref:regulatory protein RecX n=1 Tax=Dokdonella sp. TaxID=2291710 RepID=UPI0031BD5862|nr:recombination regulator RecX [Dokdonella sp.]
MPRQRPANGRSARDQALGLLARREQSARELEAKLLARGCAASEAQEVIDQLKARDYQSDERFAASLARQRSGQGYGPRRIEAELQSHGIADARIRAALDDLDMDWTALAAAQLRRRRVGSGRIGASERARHVAFLLRRGFDGPTVRAAFQMLGGDAGGALGD